MPLKWTLPVICSVPVHYAKISISTDYVTESDQSIDVTLKHHVTLSRDVNASHDNYPSR